MYRIIARAIIYLLVCSAVFVIAFFIVSCLQINISITLEALLPNIYTFYFQVILLGIFINTNDRIKKYRAKIDAYNTIKAILIEPIVRFNEPGGKSVDLDKINFDQALLLAEKNIGTVTIKHYHELLNCLSLQRQAYSGLIVLASQISDDHIWIIFNLIGIITRMFDEIQKRCPNRANYGQIMNVQLFNLGFNSVFKFYINNCFEFSKAKNKIK